MTPPGNCANVPKNVMFPEKGKGGDWRAYAAAIETAKAICEGCPQTLRCFAQAVEHGEECGVWGGVHFTAKRSRKPPNSGECGTEAGWARHKRAAIRDGTTVTCAPCSQARRRAQATRDRQRKTAR